MTVAKINPDHTEHDRQSLVLAGPITTTSTVFVDIPGAVITTKDLEEDGTYQAWVSISVEQTNNNTSVEFRADIDGTPTMERVVTFGPASAGNPESVTLIGQKAGVSAGSAIKLQWKTSGGTAQINALRMEVDGVIDSRVVL